MTQMRDTERLLREQLEAAERERDACRRDREEVTKAWEALEREFNRIDGKTLKSLNEALAHAQEQLRSREDALREVYELLALGEPDNALHGLDAYLIREGIYRGEMASNQDSKLDPAEDSGGEIQ